MIDQSTAGSEEGAHTAHRDRQKDGKEGEDRVGQVNWSNRAKEEEEIQDKCGISKAERMSRVNQTDGRTDSVSTWKKHKGFLMDSITKGLGYDSNIGLFYTICCLALCQKMVQTAL